MKTKEVTFTYDAFGNRIAKDVDETGDGVIDRSERFIYDGGDLILKTDANGNVLHRYLHGPGYDELFADEDALNEVLWALADRLGTVKDWVEHDSTTGTTSVANHLEYDAFGNIVSQTDPTHVPPVGFTGQDWDADIGMYYYSAGIPGGRWYDPVAGRFLKPDDAGFAAGDVNLYRYVGNSPGNWVDPNGNDAWVIGGVEDKIHSSISVDVWIAGPGGKRTHAGVLNFDFGPQGSQRPSGGIVCGKAQAVLTFTPGAGTGTGKAPTESTLRIEGSPKEDAQLFVWMIENAGLTDEQTMQLMDKINGGKSGGVTGKNPQFGYSVTNNYLYINRNCNGMTWDAVETYIGENVGSPLTRIQTAEDVLWDLIGNLPRNRRASSVNPD